MKASKLRRQHLFIKSNKLPFFFRVIFFSDCRVFPSDIWCHVECTVSWYLEKYKLSVYAFYHKVNIGLNCLQITFLTSIVWYHPISRLHRTVRLKRIWRVHLYLLLWWRQRLMTTGSSSSTHSSNSSAMSAFLLCEVNRNTAPAITYATKEIQDITNE